MPAFVVSAGVFGFLGSIFTRDVFFSFATYAVFWLFIFAPSFHPTTFETYVVVPASALLGALAGIALVKFLNIGQLIDITLTGSGGGDNSKEELNFPFMLLAVGFAFLTTFFTVSIIAGANFLNGNLDVDSTAAGFAVAIFALLTIVSVMMTAVGQKKRGSRFKGIYDDVSVYYTFAYALALLFPLLVWHGGAQPPSVTLGWTAAIVAVVVDAIVFGLGHRLEATKNSDNPSRRGRWYGPGAAGWRVALRYVLVIGVHAGIFGLGGHAITETGGNVVEIFFPWLFVYFVAAFILFGGIYILLMLFALAQVGSSEESSKLTTTSTPTSTSSSSFVDNDESTMRHRRKPDSDSDDNLDFA